MVNDQPHHQRKLTATFTKNGRKKRKSENAKGEEGIILSS